MSPHLLRNAGYHFGPRRLAVSGIALAHAPKGAGERGLTSEVKRGFFPVWSLSPLVRRVDVGAGKVFIAHHGSGGTLLTFNPEEFFSVPPPNLERALIKQYDSHLTAPHHGFIDYYLRSAQRLPGLCSCSLRPTKVKPFQAPQPSSRLPDFTETKPDQQACCGDGRHGMLWFARMFCRSSGRHSFSKIAVAADEGAARNLEAQGLGLSKFLWCASIFAHIAIIFFTKALRISYRVCEHATHP